MGRDENNMDKTAPELESLLSESELLRRQTKRSLYGLVGMVALFLGLTAIKCFALSNYVYSFSPDGRLMGALLSTITMTWLLVLLSVIPIFSYFVAAGTLSLVARRYRSTLLHFLCVVVFLSFVLNYRVVHWRVTAPFEKAALERVPVQGQLLVDALEAYHGQHGEYPDMLDALVPEFIEAIPPTGLSSKSRFNYYKNDENAYYRLSASRRMGILDFNFLSFSPDPEFSGVGNMGSIGAWAYIDG